MRVEYFKEYSNCLNRDMEFKVYGHAGMPLLVFPAQDGRFYDFENFWFNFFFYIVNMFLFMNGF